MHTKPPASFLRRHSRISIECCKDGSLRGLTFADEHHYQNPFVGWRDSQKDILNPTAASCLTTQLSLNKPFLLSLFASSCLFRLRFVFRYSTLPLSVVIYKWLSAAIETDLVVDPISSSSHIAGKPTDCNLMIHPSNRTLSRYRECRISDLEREGERERTQHHNINLDTVTIFLDTTFTNHKIQLFSNHGQ